MWWRNMALATSVSFGNAMTCLLSTNPLIKSMLIYCQFKIFCHTSNEKKHTQNVVSFSNLKYFNPTMTMLRQTRLHPNICKLISPAMLKSFLTLFPALCRPMFSVLVGTKLPICTIIHIAYFTIQQKYSTEQKLIRIIKISDHMQYSAHPTNDISIENSAFDQNLQCSGLKCTLLITTQICTRHNSVTVVTRP